MDISRMGTTMTLMGISLVDASNIKSLWQANFMQIFPIDSTTLPIEHETDKKCFEENWQGDPDITFEEFNRR